MSTPLEFDKATFTVDTQPLIFSKFSQQDSDFNIRRIGEFKSISGYIIIIHEDDIHLWPNRLIIDVQSVFNDVKYQSRYLPFLHKDIPGEYNLWGSAGPDGDLNYLSMEGFSSLDNNDEILSLAYLIHDNPQIADVIAPSAQKLIEQIGVNLNVDISTTQLLSPIARQTIADIIYLATSPGVDLTPLGTLIPFYDALDDYFRRRGDRIPTPSVQQYMYTAIPSPRRDQSPIPSPPRSPRRSPVMESPRSPLRFDGLNI